MEPKSNATRSIRSREASIRKEKEEMTNYKERKKAIAIMTATIKLEEARRLKDKEAIKEFEDELKQAKEMPEI